MDDLVAMQPNLNIQLLLVAPEDRREKVFAEVNRPTFSRLDPRLAEIPSVLNRGDETGSNLVGGNSLETTTPQRISAGSAYGTQRILKTTNRNCAAWPRR